MDQEVQLERSSLPMPRIGTYGARRQRGYLTDMGHAVGLTMVTVINCPSAAPTHRPGSQHSVLTGHLYLPPLFPSVYRSLSVENRLPALKAFWN